MFTLRFDMRAPAAGASATELYAAAIDMCSWAETRGALIAVLSDEAAASIRRGTPLPLLPLCGGVPPDIAWPYLERAGMASEQA